MIEKYNNLFSLLSYKIVAVVTSLFLFVSGPLYAASPGAGTTAPSAAGASPSAPSASPLPSTSPQPTSEATPSIAPPATHTTRVDEEETFVPSFRSGHNLSAFISGEYTNWNVIQSSTPSTQDDAIQRVDASKPVIGLFFRYAYHINIISSFGFFIGSTVGIFASNGSYGLAKNFYPGYGVPFPTVMAGLVQNIGQDFRLLAGTEYSAAWFPKMTISSNNGVNKALNPTLDMISVFTGVDHFLNQNTAISLNLGYRQMRNPCLNNCIIPPYINSLKIVGQSYFTQLGVTWVVGDFNQLL